LWENFVEEEFRTDALIQLCGRGVEAASGETGERSPSEIIAPYHKMLDTFDSEMVGSVHQNPNDNEGTSRLPDTPRKEIDQDTSSESETEKSSSESEAEEPDTDSEDDERASKKPKHFKLDFSNLTHPAVIRRKKKLSSSLQKTNALLKNWAHNPKKVKRKWLVSPFLPEFPESELYNIIRGRVVNFDVVFSGFYSDSVEQDDCEEKLGKVKIKVMHASEPAKSVRSSQDWSVAFSCFEHAMCFAFPHRRDKIADYGKSIHQKFARSEVRFHPRILAFDRAVRKRVSRRNDLELSDFNQFADLFQAHCSSIGNQSGAQDSNASSGSKHHHGNPVECCRRWNNGVCTRSATSCNFKHACISCGSSEHPEKTCGIRK
jgi:hypothetical protein